MLIPHLHFCGDCNEAIEMYKKAFNTKVDEIVRYFDFDPVNYAGDRRVGHANMKIHGQTVFLNDRFGNKNKSLNCAVHLIVTFETAEQLLACYEKMKDGGNLIDPFAETPYSKLVGNFMDKFGVLWGFMVGQF